SGCFFNGVAHVCLFEPLFPLLCFSSGFDSFFGFGFATDNTAGDLSSGNAIQAGMDESLWAATPLDLETSPENPTNNPESAAIAKGAAADQFGRTGVFILVLKNGTRHGATDYWVTDGYLE